MPAPDTYITPEELKRAVGAVKVLQLMPDGTGKRIDEVRLRDAMLDAVGEVRGSIQSAITPKSIDDLWDRWTDADKAEIKRLAKQLGIYYVHYYGEGNESIPETVVSSRDLAREDLTALGKRLRTAGAEPTPDSSTHHALISPIGVGKFERGEPSLRGDFSRGSGGFC